MTWALQILAGLAVVCAFVGAACVGGSGARERAWERVTPDGHRSEGPAGR